MTMVAHDQKVWRDKGMWFVEYSERAIVQKRQ